MGRGGGSVARRMRTVRGPADGEGARAALTRGEAEVGRAVCSTGLRALSGWAVWPSPRPVSCERVGGDAGLEQGRIAQDVEALGLQRGEGPGHRLPLFGWVGHARGQPVVALSAERHGGGEARAMERGVGGALPGGALLLGAWRYAELVQAGVDGGEQTRDAAAVLGVRPAGFRVVDHFVHRRPGLPVADHRPALVVLGRRFLWWRDDHRAAVGEGGVDDVVAQAVLDGYLQAALAEGSGEVAVPVIRFRILGDHRGGAGAGPRGDVWPFLLDGDQGVVLVHGFFSVVGRPDGWRRGPRSRGAGRTVVHKDLVIGRLGPAGSRCYGRQRERPGTGGPGTGGAGREAGRVPCRPEVDRARATRACSVREDCSGSARSAR